MTTNDTQPTLAELILTKKGNRTFAKLSKDCGGVPTDRRLNSLVNAPMKGFPDAESIERLAIGLRVNVTDVVLASARSLGLPVATSEPGSLVLAGAGYLPSSAKEALAEMAGELLKLQQSIGSKKPFTEYQARLRQDFMHGARLRRVPATEIESALQGPGWYMVTPEDDDVTAADAALGWVTGDHAHQLKAALRDVLTEGSAMIQAELELSADKGHSTISAEAEAHHT